MCLYFICYLYKGILFFLFYHLQSLVSKPFIYCNTYSDAHIVITNLSQSQDNKTVKKNKQTQKPFDSSISRFHFLLSSDGNKYLKMTCFLENVVCTTLLIELKR